MAIAPFQSPHTGILLAKSGIRESGEHSWKVRDRTHIWLQRLQHHRFRGLDGECIKRRHWRDFTAIDLMSGDEQGRRGKMGDRLNQPIQMQKMLYLESVWKFCLQEWEDLRTYQEGGMWVATSTSLFLLVAGPPGGRRCCMTELALSACPSL